MPHLTPVSRAEFIKKLISLGFEGPFSGGKHQYFIKGKVRLHIPNPHKKEIGIDLLQKLLKQIGISKEEWIKM